MVRPIESTEPHNNAKNIVVKTGSH